MLSKIGQMAYFFVWESIKNLNLFVEFVEIWYTKIKQVWFGGDYGKNFKKINCSYNLTKFVSTIEGNWIDYRASSFGGGSGTKDDPYLISTPVSRW